MSNLVPFYPPIDRSNPEKIARQLAEIADFSSLDYSQTIPSNVGFLPHQHFVSRFLSSNTPYPSLLLYHVPGSGKSCAAVAFAMHMPMDYKLVYVSSNADTGSAFLNAVRSTCRRQKDEDQPNRSRRAVKHATDGRLLNRVGGIRRESLKHYTYVEFSGEIKNNPRAFRNAYVVIDEVHNICPSNNTKDTSTLIAEAYARKPDEPKININAHISQIYNNILEFIVDNPRNKYLLLTGTPIIDNPAGIYYIGKLLEAAGGCRELVYDHNSVPTLMPDLNGLKPSKFKRTLFKKNIKYTVAKSKERNAPFPSAELNTQGRSLIEKVYAGKVSHMGSKFIIRNDHEPMPGADRIYPLVLDVQGPNTPWDYSGITKNKWLGLFGLSEPYTYSGTDHTKYKPILVPMQPAQQRMVKRAEVSTKGTGFFADERKFSLLAYDKISELAYISKHILPLSTAQFTKRYGKRWGTIDALRQVSCIYASVIEDILKHPKQQHFVYFDQLKTAGALVFARILELYDVNGQHFSELGPGSRTPAPRYVILTSGMTGKGMQIASVVNKVINIPANRNGEIVSVIIGTRAASEAFSLKNVQTIHIMTPFFNWTRIEQALSRGTRYDSLQFLPREERNVRLFLWAACYSEEVDLHDSTQRVISPDRSIQVALYRLMRLKDERNKVVLQILKDLSVDRQIEQRSLKRQTDISRRGRVTRESDSGEVGGLVMFYMREGDRLREDIKELISKSSMMTLSELSSHFPRVSLSILSLTLSNIIENKEIIPSLYGFSSFLSSFSSKKGNDHLYYLSPFHSVLSNGEDQMDALLSNYTTNPLFRETRDMYFYMKHVFAIHLKNSLKMILDEMRTSLPKFKSLIGGMPHEEKIMLLECIISSGNMRKITTEVLVKKRSDLSYPQLERAIGDPEITEVFIKNFVVLLDELSNHFFYENNSIYHTAYHYKDLGSGYNISHQRIEETVRVLDSREGWRTAIMGNANIKEMKKRKIERNEAGDEELLLRNRNLAYMVTTGRKDNLNPVLHFRGLRLNTKKRANSGAGKKGDSFNLDIGKMMAYLVIMSRYPTYKQMIEVAGKKYLSMDYETLFRHLKTKGALPKSRLNSAMMEEIMSRNRNYFSKDNQNKYDKQLKLVSEQPNVMFLDADELEIEAGKPLRAGNTPVGLKGKVETCYRFVAEEFGSSKMSMDEMKMTSLIMTLSKTKKSKPFPSPLPPHVNPISGGVDKMFVLVFYAMDLVT